MAQIELTKGRFALVDEEDLGNLSAYSWCATGKDGRLYAQRSYRDASGKIIKVAMHRMITGAAKGMVVDHINGNPLDNRRSNLRVVTNQENTWNRRPRGATGLNGVRANKGRWNAQVAPHGIEISLGTFGTKEEAAAAYDVAASAVYGDKAYLNGITLSHINMDFILSEKRERLDRVRREIEILTTGA